MNWLRMIGVAGAFGIVLSLAGCGGDGDNTDNASGPPTVNVTGKWLGSSTDAYGSVRWKSSIYLVLSQQASGAVQGTVKVSTQEAASGLVEGDHLTLSVNYGGGMVGTYSLQVEGNTMTARLVSRNG